jgi:F-type H+-transporting ATPase subunit alpha
MELGQQVCIMYAVINGFLDDVPIEKVKSWETEFHVYIEAAHPEIRRGIMETGQLDDETQEKLKGAIEEFKKAFSV